MMTATRVLDSFISFLTLLAVTFSARNRRIRSGSALRGAYVRCRGAAGHQSRRRLLVHRRLRRARCRGAGAGLTAGLLFTGVTWFSGPLAATWIGSNGPGWAATIAAPGGLYALLPRPTGHKDDTRLHS
jgi:hypothetical protein